ncbi:MULTISPECIES: protein transport protein HofC [Tenebrionibacter/Tenebrionicola group]|uniref:Protein transport protein HofC n=1 Tax=Tenebrionibacter intestinalis TaxID=2799638 RepID=A0A8K0UZ63_9ENTR|nr:MULTISPECIES: protein transport protein HofC [Tenebrionibacter/Tenebrionicola group]MBK4713979.1 protein transport protein HofC [Tenebrionibacter intestinalis]MBV4412519.1 protein transport protein HofC [Tenebrionicola larvae]
MKNNNPRLWRWRALEPGGALSQGYALAINRADALAGLLARQLAPIALRQAFFSPRRSWRLRNKIDFLRQLAALLHAGVALDNGCRLLARQHPVPAWQALLEQTADRLAQGQTLSSILGQWPAIFPPLFIALLHTGEMTGKLDTCCQQLATQQEQHYRLKKKVHKALRYPFFTLLIALLVSGGMLGFVLPEFASIYQSFNAPLPGLTQNLITLSEWLRHNVLWCFTLFIIPVAGWITVRRKPRWQNAQQRLLLKIPLLSDMLRGQRLCQIHTTLALTQQAGIALLQGIEAAEMALTHPWWQQKLRAMRERIRNGDTFSHALSQAEIFTPLCIQLARTGEESGSLDIMLSKLADWHTGRTQERADGLAAALEPVMMLVMGGVTGTLVIAMYLPIFQLGEAMSMG